MSTFPPSDSLSTCGITGCLERKEKYYLFKDTTYRVSQKKVPLSYKSRSRTFLWDKGIFFLDTRYKAKKVVFEEKHENTRER